MGFFDSPLGMHIMNSDYLKDKILTRADERMELFGESVEEAIGNALEDCDCTEDDLMDDDIRAINEWMENNSWR